MSNPVVANVIAILALIVTVSQVMVAKKQASKSLVERAEREWSSLFSARDMTRVMARLSAQGGRLKGSNRCRFADEEDAMQAQRDFGFVVAMLEEAKRPVNAAQEDPKTWKRIASSFHQQLQDLIDSVDELRWEASKNQVSWDTLTLDHRLEYAFIQAIDTLNGFEEIRAHDNGAGTPGLHNSHPDPWRKNRTSAFRRSP